MRLGVPGCAFWHPDTPTTLCTTSVEIPKIHSASLCQLCASLCRISATDMPRQGVAMFQFPMSTGTSELGREKKGFRPGFRPLCV